MSYDDDQDDLVEGARAIDELEAEVARLKAEIEEAAQLRDSKVLENRELVDSLRVANTMLEKDLALTEKCWREQAQHDVDCLNWNDDTIKAQAYEAEALKAEVTRLKADLKQAKGIAKRAVDAMESRSQEAASLRAANAKLEEKRLLQAELFAAIRTGFRPVEDWYTDRDLDGLELAAAITQAVLDLVDDRAEVLKHRTTIQEQAGELERLNTASMGIGSWLSAALGDEKVCDEMKADIDLWFAALRVPEESP